MVELPAKQKFVFEVFGRPDACLNSEPAFGRLSRDLDANAASVSKPPPNAPSVTRRGTARHGEARRRRRLATWPRAALSNNAMGHNASPEEQLFERRRARNSARTPTPAYPISRCAPRERRRRRRGSAPAGRATSARCRR
jgi:hypothetical protein